MDSTVTMRIAFLIIIILSCLSVYYLFGKGTTKKEGFLVEKIVDFNDQGQPKNPLMDEYGNLLTDGYYFVPVTTSEKWTTGTQDYKQYTLKSVPYGFTASADKKSIMPKTNVANVSMGTETPSSGGMKYDPNVLPSSSDALITEVPTPTSSEETPLEGGVYYQYDQTGKLVEVNYKESNFAPVLYYMPGAYKFGSSAFVPTYEDSVYLSRSTRNAQLLPGVEANAGLGGAPINSDAQLGGFCNANENNKVVMEEKCNAMPLDSCASTSCCVLLGGQKCVAGNENGPYMTANYTDYTIMPRNKDFYYYQGKCYGNCMGRTESMESETMPSVTTETMPSDTIVPVSTTVPVSVPASTSAPVPVSTTVPVSTVSTTMSVSTTKP